MVDFVVVYTLLEEGDHGHCQMNKLLTLLFDKFKGYGFCSKSYTKNCIAAAIGRRPVTCDVEFVDYSIRNERLFKRLRFFTSIEVADQILLSKAPQRLAMWLWTRKECIYKYYNKRNIVPPDVLVRTNSKVQFEENRITTIMVRNDLALSYLHLAEGSSLLLEYKYGELHEKI